MNNSMSQDACVQVIQIAKLELTPLLCFRMRQGNSPQAVPPPPIPGGFEVLPGRYGITSGGGWGL